MPEGAGQRAVSHALTVCCERPLSCSSCPGAAALVHAGAGAQCDGEDWLAIGQIPELDYTTSVWLVFLPAAWLVTRLLAGCVLWGGRLWHVCSQLGVCVAAALLLRNPPYSPRYVSHVRAGAGLVPCLQSMCTSAIWNGCRSPILATPTGPTGCTASGAATSPGTSSTSRFEGGVPHEVPRSRGLHAVSLAPSAMLGTRARAVTWLPSAASHHAHAGGAACAAVAANQKRPAGAGAAGAAAQRLPCGGGRGGGA